MDAAKYYSLESHEKEQGALEQRLKSLWSHQGLLVFPTESFYAIGMKDAHTQARERLEALKQRKQKAVAWIAADLEAVLEAVELSSLQRKLAEAFWPGPLTLVAQPKHAWMRDAFFSSSWGLGVRISSSALAREVARSCGGLLSATSANLPGEPPVTRISDLAPEVVDSVDLVLDGGETAGMLPSTLVAEREGKLVVLREGALAIEKLAAFAEVSVFSPRGV